jgi:pimeloyl-[acyl-carrier protein] methyl ester esterase
MNQLWINRQQNKKCILFFNGWGMDENAIRHLGYPGYDLCMVNDYRTIGPWMAPNLNYEEIDLVAWSLGVWAAEQALGTARINITRSIAINGTPHPVHDEMGIPGAIFTATLHEWSEKNRTKFNMRMMGGRQNYQQYNFLLSQRTVDHQKEELKAIFQQYKTGRAVSLRWDKAIIGTNDMIFTTQNQLNWWTGKTSIATSPIPHFPFARFDTWTDIIHR